MGLFKAKTKQKLGSSGPTIDTTIWNAMSYLVFFMLFTILWREVYESTLSEIDEAFKHHKEDPNEKPITIFQRVERVVMLKIRHEHVPPYPLSNVVSKTVYVYYKVIVYILLLYFVCYLIDNHIVEKCMDGKHVNEKNFLFNVLSSFVLEKFRFVLMSCFSCIAVLFLITVILNFTMPYILFKRKSTRLIAMLMMMFVLCCMPSLTLVKMIIGLVQYAQGSFAKPT